MQGTVADVVEAASDAYVAIDEAGAIRDWNSGAERIFSWSRQDVLGVDLVAVLALANAADGPATSVERLFEIARGPVADRRVELEVGDRRGRRFPVEGPVWCTGDGDSTTLHVLLHDVSDRRAAKDNLYRMAALVYSLDEAVLGVDPTGTILSWNSGAERTFGYPAFEMVGRNASVLVPAEDEAELARWWDVMVRKQRVQRGTISGVRKNGVVLQLDVTLSPLHDGHGSVSGGSLVARDVTEQRWMAATVERTLSSLEDALKQAQESEARYRRFLADAAHQLRTPIAGIRASAETLLRQSTHDDRKEELLLNVVRETSRASRVMAGVLRMARVDHGETLTFRRCDVVAVCAEEVERVRVLSPELEVNVRLERRPPSPPELDVNVVREILANLLDNARRHATRAIDVVVTAEAETVGICVRDDGRGVPDAWVERIFDRFVTLDGKGGSGLGLPIARGLARAHGGDLRYDGGFLLRLPAKAPVECGGAAWPGSRLQPP
jgi:PAS domain S-box-containing protein